MSVWSLIAHSVDETMRIASVLGGSVMAKDAIFFNGKLGAGKTTFIQGIAKGMKIYEPVFSPTFIMARKYKSHSMSPDLLHVDAYRMSSTLTCEDLGIEDVIDTTTCVVEWGDLIKESLLVLDFGRILEVEIVADTSSIVQHGIENTSYGENRSIIFTPIRGNWQDVQEAMI